MFIIPKDKIDELGLSDHDIIKKETISGFGIAKGKDSFVRDHVEHEDLW